MKKILLLISFFTLPAVAQDWTNYPVVTTPLPSDTFLLGTTNGTVEGAPYTNWDVQVAWSNIVVIFDPAGAATADFQQAMTNLNLTNGLIVGWVEAGYQPLSTDLNQWSGVSTNAWWTAMASYNASTYQPLSANLTIWSGVSTNVFLNYLTTANYNAGWGAWPTNVLATFDHVGAASTAQGNAESYTVGYAQPLSSELTALSGFNGAALTNTAPDQTDEYYEIINGANQLITSGFGGLNSVPDNGQLSAGFTYYFPMDGAAAKAITSPLTNWTFQICLFQTNIVQGGTFNTTCRVYTNNPVGGIGYYTYGTYAINWTGVGTNLELISTNFSLPLALQQTNVSIDILGESNGTNVFFRWARLFAHD
jgi:hypothetical protein